MMSKVNGCLAHGLELLEDLRVDGGGSKELRGREEGRVG